MYYAYYYVGERSLTWEKGRRRSRPGYYAYYVCMYICIYVYVYIYIYVINIYIYIYIYTHIDGILIYVYIYIYCLRDVQTQLKSPESYVGERPQPATCKHGWSKHGSSIIC